jgi:RNA polymerase sigma-70 factor (ECF subfamily)
VAEAEDGSEFERARRAAEERELVNSARRGSKPAFEALYRNHVGKIYGLCLRMTAHPATAEDCTQETFIQAWRSLPSFERRSAFGTWLHRIAVNAVLAQGRRRREELGQAASADDLAAARPDPSVGDTGAAMDLEQAIAGLPAGARQVPKRSSSSGVISARVVSPTTKMVPLSGRIQRSWNAVRSARVTAFTPASSPRPLNGTP